MKGLWKRITAFALMLCMLLSVMPPVVIAVEGEQQPQSVTYDFSIEQNATLTHGSGASFAGASFGTASVKTAVDNYYADGTLNWNYISHNCNSVMFAGSWGQGMRLNGENGEYVALKIKAPGTGVYKLTVNHLQRTDGTDGAVYILAGDTADVAAALASATAVGTYNSYAATNGSTTTATDLTQLVTFEAGQEYICVLRIVEDSTSTLKNYPCSMIAEFVEDIPQETTASQETTAPQQEPVTYDFSIEQNAALTHGSGASFAGASFGTASVKTAVDNYYADGTLNWNYISHNCNSVMFAGSWGQGMRLNGENGEYVALKIKAPGTGVYKLTVNHLQRTDGTDGAVYILPGDTADVAAALASATAVGTYNSYAATNGTAVTELANTVTFTAGEEYILVLRLVIPNTSTLKNYPCSLVAEFVGSQPEETTSPNETTAPEETTVPEETTAPEIPELDPMVFDFALLQDHAFTYGGSNYFASYGPSTAAWKNGVDALYAAGDLNWKVHSYSYTGGSILWGGVNGTRDYKWNGVRISSVPGSYIAFTVKAPATGKYDLTLGYMTHKNGDTGKMYILPGDTADVAAALRSATPTVQFNCLEGGVDPHKANSVLAAQGYELTKDTEYVVVFEVVSEQTKAEQQIYVTSLILTPEGQQAPEIIDPSVPKLQLDKAVYDFTAAAVANGTSLNYTNADIAQLYTSGALNWKYETKSRNNQSTMMGGTSTDGATVRAWNGVRFAAKPGIGWVAMRIVSPGTGNYSFTVDYQTYTNYAEVEVYVLPANTSDIDAALQEAKSIGSYDCYSSKGAYQNATATLKKAAELTSGREYIVVFCISNDSNTNIYGTFHKLTLNKVAADFGNTGEEEEQIQAPAAERDQVKYDFDLGATSLLMKGESFATKSLSNGAVSIEIGKYYRNYALDWKFHSATTEGLGSAVSQIAYFGGKFADKDYKWSGLRMYVKTKPDAAGNSESVHNFYYALTLRSPGTGNYKLTVDYGVHKTGAMQGSFYILPADTADIAEALKTAKAVGTLDYDSGAQDSAAYPEMGRTTYGNAVSLEAGKEYILVMTSDVMGRSDSRLYVNSVTLTKEGTATPADIIPYRKPQPKPIPAGSTVYDVDLNDPIKGIYKKKTLVLDVVDEINNRYEKGLSNWGWQDQMMVSEDDIAFISTGLTTYGDEMEWFAIKVKAPKAGLYTVGLNHAISGNGGTGAVYVLPADTEDIDKAMDPTNRVGKITFMNDTGITAASDGEQSLIGTWEFGEDEEYIIVFEGYDNAPYHDSRSYMFISQLFLTPGDITEEKEEVKTITPVTADPGPIKILEGTLYGVTTKVNGCDYLFYGTEGGIMLVVDLDNNVLVDEVKTPFTVPRGMTVDENGIVWVAGDGTLLFRYDPVAQTGQTMKRYKNQATDAQSSFDLIYADGCLYFGVYPTGALMKYDIAANTYTNLGKYHSDANYVCGIVYKDGFVYAGVNGDKNSDGYQTWLVAKVDPKTAELVKMVDVTHLMPELSAGAVMFRGAGLAGDLMLLGGDNSQQKIVAIDTNTMEIVDLGINAGINYGVTEEVNGKVYFVLNGMGLYEMDVQTREIKAVPGMKDANVGIRCADHSIVEVDDKLYPGLNIVTYSSGNGIPRLYNLEKGMVKNYFEVIGDDYGQPTDIRTLINGLPGSNQLLIGAYNTDECAIYNTQTGITSEYTAYSAQTDAQLIYKDVLYTGNYPAAAITRVNMEDETRNQVLLSLNDEQYDQARIHTLTAGDDMIFAGTVPDRYGYGGCLAWVDLNTLERHVERNVVQDQTINCLVYHDGYIYGTSSIYGGTGSALRTDLSAKLFVYDVENKQKVAEFDLRNYISGLTGNIEFISGIAADPNVAENGRFWGLVSETLFTFSYDVETGKLTVKEELSYGKNTYDIGGGRNWFPRPFRFDGEGNLYLAFNSNGGIRRINTENIADNERVMPITPMHYVLGEDGNLWYLRGRGLFMYPLNVTEEDWEEADKVDQLILAIGDEITLDSEEKIVAARSAYEALNIKDKALVQKLEILEEAESDLMELQIADLPETITLEHQTLLEGLQAKYDSMTAHQQKYVKNYDVLEAKLRELKALLDAKAAAEVQAMIDSIKDLGELTLDHKDRIIEIRAAYDALTSYQKTLVDATALLEAEAIMAVLRAEAIEHLKELIASIGEVTLEDEPTIVEADGIFSWLTLEERQQVDGATLSSAKIQLTKLQKEAAGKVDVLIEKIGKVGIFSGAAISKARKAYDALTEGSKAYVSLIDTLLAAEKAFLPIAITLWCVGGVVVAGGGAAAVIVLKKKRKAVPAKEIETAE